MEPTARTMGPGLSDDATGMSVAPEKDERETIGSGATGYGMKRLRHLLANQKRSPEQRALGTLLNLFLAISVPANAATGSDFVAACLESTNFEESVCECMAAKAEKRLSPKSLDFLVASFQKDDEAASRLRAELSFSEFLASGTFMAHAPAECAGGPAGHAH